MDGLKEYIVIYLVLINIVTYFMFLIDKKKAEKHRYRISEKALLTACFLGGSLGGIISMKRYHHKTKKWKFKILPWIFLIAEGFVFIYRLFLI